MSETKISHFYNKGHRSRGANKLKFFLMPFVMFVLFGFPTRFGGYVQLFSNFAAPAFYILCGFFVLCPDENDRKAKIKRALKKSFKFFLLLFISYVAINIIYLYFSNVQWLPEIFRIRTFFGFFVLNIWPEIFPVGSSIWFIQSLMYAYVFFYFADKLKLLRFYLPFLAVFYIFMIFTGELSALTGFPYYGYYFIPGGAVTRAIPYMLVGMLIRNNLDKFLAHRRFIYIIFFVLGIGLAYSEIRLLSYLKIFTYAGHLIGHGVMAVSICCFALSSTKKKKGFLFVHGKNYARRMYALCQPVSFIITLFTAYNIVPKYFVYVMEYRSIIVYFVCLLLAYLIGLIKFFKS